MRNINLVVVVLGIFFFSCSDKEGGDLSEIIYSPTNYNLDYPAHFPKMIIPANNPITEEGVELGRFLFFDPILSADSTMSCATCHEPARSFTDGVAVSTGIRGLEGTRNSMSLINIGFTQNGLFWDGRVNNLEAQALMPVEDPLELDNTWPNVISKLKVHPIYPKMFREAFGIEDKSEITKELAAKAIAQFERTLISKDSKFDRVEAKLERYDDLELIGRGIFFDEDPDLPDGECGHCHNTPLGTSDDYFNNGLTNALTFEDFKDKGRGLVTKSRFDNGKFKAPTLRNIKLTAPYMHNGSLATFEDVMNHYNKNIKKTDFSDALIAPLNFDPFYLSCLEAFIDTFTDTVFVNNPKFQSPFK